MWRNGFCTLIRIWRQRPGKCWISINQKGISGEGWRRGRSICISMDKNNRRQESGHPAQGYVSDEFLYGFLYFEDKSDRISCRSSHLHQCRQRTRGVRTEEHRMNQSLKLSIQKIYPNLRRSEKKVADYLLSHTGAYRNLTLEDRKSTRLNSSH